MTREEIQAMVPGRELDELVIEWVMGWEPVQPSRPDVDWCWGDGNRAIPAGLWNPSTDISAAWEVLSKMLEMGAEVNVGYFEEWDCAIDYPIECNWRATAETAPEAICKAALLAVREVTI